MPTENAVILSRPETLLGVNPETLEMFEQRYTLAEEAETEDGESSDEISDSDMLGLHAKVYVFERGWDTHLVIGSGNATNAALVAGSNVEVMAESYGQIALTRSNNSVDHLPIQVKVTWAKKCSNCLLYTSDAADE